MYEGSRTVQVAGHLEVLLRRHTVVTRYQMVCITVKVLIKHSPLAVCASFRNLVSFKSASAAYEALIIS
jgi:hypothetical protein